MDVRKEMMYDIDNYGNHDIRRFSEIRIFPRISSLFIRQKDPQGSPHSDYQTEVRLVNQRALHQEIPQASPKARSSQEAINVLTIYTYTYIISLVGGIYGKR